MPRIITVDPTGAISRIVRSAMDLLDLSVIQVDVPHGADALEELARQANLVVTAYNLDDEMKGWEFAMRVNKAAPETAVLILGDAEDPEFDDETAAESPFVYMTRPVDIHLFLRVLVAGMESQEAMRQALRTISGGGGGIMLDEVGPVPAIDVAAAESVLDGFMADLGAMAIVLATRSGEVLSERGAVGYIDRNALAESLIPVMHANIGIKDIVGGNVSTLQLYDGEDYDIFVLTVGLHHFVCIVFDGQQGSRQFGMVRTSGRRAVEDLIALIGANAFFIQPPKRKEAELPHRPTTKPARQEDDEPIELARADLSNGEAEPVEEEVYEPEPPAKLEPIDNLDLDLLFGDESKVSDDLFDIDNMEEIAKENSPQRKGTITEEEARELGLL